MNDGGVADGDPVADEAGEVVRKVKHGVILHVAVVADDDAVDVAPDDGVVPDAGAIADFHIADHHGAPGDVNAFTEPWFLPEKLIQLLLKLGC